MACVCGVVLVLAWRDFAVESCSQEATAAGAMGAEYS